MGYIDTIKQAERMKEMEAANAAINAKNSNYLMQLLDAKSAAVAKAKANAKLQTVHENAFANGYDEGESAALSKIWKAIEARSAAGIPINEGFVE